LTCGFVGAAARVWTLIVVVIFYTKIHDWMLVPLTAANKPPAPAELRHALTVIDDRIEHYRTRARLPTAA
jgi:hypothetical protein